MYIILSGTYAMYLREVHCLFLEHFLNTSTKISNQSFDFCDPFRNYGSETDQNTTKKERSRIL